MPAITHLFHDVGDLGQKFGFADALRLIVVDGLLEQDGELPIEERIFIHLLGDRLLGSVCYHVGLGAWRSDFVDLSLESLALKDVYRRDDLDDLVSLYVGREHFLDLFLIIAVVDFFGVAYFYRGADFLKKHRIPLVAFDLCGVGRVEP